MKRISRVGQSHVSYGRAFIAALLLGFVTNAQAVEKSARVVSVGTCWTGYNAVVVTMDNGDKLVLGNLADDLTKARYSAALTAKATGELVFYQIPATALVCSITRGEVEWWMLGGTMF